MNGLVGGPTRGARDSGREVLEGVRACRYGIALTQMFYLWSYVTSLQQTVEEPGGVIVSYGEDGEPVSVEFLNASARRLILPGEVSVTIHTEGLGES